MRITTILLATLSLAACSQENAEPKVDTKSESSASAEHEAAPTSTTPALPNDFETKVYDRGDGLKVEIYAPGSGPEIATGSHVRFHYDARIVGKSETFDSTRGSGIPMELEIGSSRGPKPIEGLSRGLIGLRAGSRAKLTIPAKLAWGEQGNSQIGVPPNSEVSFAVEILSVQ